MDLLFGRKTATGIDLGEHAVKCATLEPETGRLRGAHAVELMPERERRTDALDSSALDVRLRTALGDCQRQCAPWSKAVVAALPARAGQCGYLDLPALTERELDLAVPSKISKLIPFPLTEVSVSHMVVPLVRPGADRTGVVYVSVQKGPLQQLTDLFGRLGLRVRRAELPAVPLAREFHRNHPEEAGSFTALVNAGFRNSLVAIVRGGFPYLSRSFALGGADFTYAFQMGAQSTWSRAEAYKGDYDFRRREPAIEPFLVRWMDEVRKTVVQFERRFTAEEVRVARVALSGGDAHRVGLAERLAEHLEIAVEADGWAGLQGPAEAPGRFKIAVGLALGD